MWRDWRPDVVAADFVQLAGAGLTTVRVFALWSDFQPLEQTSGYLGEIKDYRHGEGLLPDTAAGRAGMDECMLQRFRLMADEALKNGVQLIAGLITGWMSGRLFTPHAFTNLNVLTDPEVLRWQMRFARCFVETLRDHPAIVAWDLGNECNCMAAATAAESWIWTSVIATAIRAVDPDRPIVSGMHSLEADPRKAWSMAGQGELTDFLTTHPYPPYTRFCDHEAISTLRPQLHATIESLYYAGVGGKPCFAEEMGSMGSTLGSDEIVVSFVRPSLYSLWAHDCRAMLWWCAYDIVDPTRAPYDSAVNERELGLFRTDRSAKPVLHAIADFKRVVNKLPIATLPPRIIDATCLLTQGQDQWAAAQSAFILAKLAGADVAFHWFGDPLPESPIYLLPGLCVSNALSHLRWEALLARIKTGATLYISIDDAALVEIIDAVPHPFHEMGFHCLCGKFES